MIANRSLQFLESNNKMASIALIQLVESALSLSFTMGA